MGRSNGSQFTQHIAPDGIGHQHYYDGQGHQINNGSGTINNYNGIYPSVDSSREEILQALYKSPYLQRKNRNPDRVEGTCEWFMNHPNFRQWRNNTASSMLWVSANPGCGKSVLAKYLVDELKKTRQRTTCYFFFKDDFGDQKSAKGALSCILHQLFIQKDHLLSAEIMKRFKSYRAPPANSYYEHDLYELWDILTTAAQEREAGEIICILDAFDECADQERQELAKILREFYRPRGDTEGTVNLKFLITSRPYDTIRQGLVGSFDIQDCPVIHLKGEGDTEVKGITQEIRIYIKDRVSRFRANFHLNEKEEDILLQGLEAIPNQTYLWVYLTLEWIETELNNKISEAGIRNAISTLPRTVDEAYDKILDRSTNVEETKKLLHIVVAAQRPLTLAEMELALTIREDHESYKDLALRPDNRVRKDIRDLCGLFINITDGKIYLLHQTAKEFLVPRDNPDSQKYSPAQLSAVFRKGPTSGPTWKFSLIPSESHRILCKICIWHLLFTEFETRPPTRAADVTKYLCDHLFLGYSAKTWAAHFRASNITGNEIIEQLQRLCNVTSHRCPAWFGIYWTDIYANFPLEFTTLMIASYFGIKKIVRLQIESDGVEIDSVDGSNYRTALSFASENGFDSVVRLLIKGPKLYGKKGLKKAVRLSYAKGADVNAKDEYKRTALFYAVWNGHVPIVKRLLKAGARVDMMDTIGGTPISYALCYGQEDIATELMRGAQRDSVDGIRRKLLLSAVKHGHDPVVKRLLDSGANIQVTDDDGATLLILAARHGHEPVVKRLLDSGADIQLVNDDGATLLTLAVMYGHDTVVKRLLDSGADIQVTDDEGASLLMLAVKHGHDTVVKRLLDSGADPEATDDKGVSPVNLATRQGKTNIVKLLIEKGADANKGDNIGITPLILAIRHGIKNVIEFLIKKGADVNMGNYNNRTPLTLAIALVEIDVVELLVEKGADVNKSDYYNETPLRSAIRYGLTKVIELLIEKGADVNMGDRDGKTALLLAIIEGETDVIELLIEKGADVNKSDRDGKTALLLAIIKGKTDVIELLIEKGADVNKSDRDGKTALVLAIIKGKTDVIKLLIEKGANVNKSDHYNETPLTSAIYYGLTKVIELLIKKGAGVNMGDRDGKTALVVAMQGRHHARCSDMVEMLLKGGARVDYTFTNVSTPSGSLNGPGHEPITPLLYAIDWSMDKIVDLLLRYGANPKFVGGCRFTPLEAAKRKRDDLNTEFQRLEDDWRTWRPNLQPIQRSLASSNAIVQMLEDAIRA